MSDIFAEKNIYPHEGKFKDHFKDFYKTVFVAFLPFFQVDRQPTNDANLKKSKQITYGEAKEEIEVLKDIPPFNANIFSYSNKDYPTDEEIYKSGKPITWDTIVKGSGLKDYSELNKALRTSIGALKQVLSRPELTEKLNKFTADQNIWHPTEGCFDMLSKVAIYKTFKLLEKTQIVVTDEFYQTTSSLDLDKLSDFEFSEKVGHKDYYVYSADKEVLFTIEWDSFFFIIGADSEKMQQIIKANLFEGFICNDRTQQEWDFEEGEIQSLLDIEEEQILQTIHPTPQKKWWKFWK